MVDQSTKEQLFRYTYDDAFKNKILGNVFCVQIKCQERWPAGRPTADYGVEACKENPPNCELLDDHQGLVGVLQIDPPCGKGSLPEWKQHNSKHQGGLDQMMHGEPGVGESAS